MEAFRDVLADCGLFDLGFSGVPWTYDNKQSGLRNVRVRLDRVVASANWSNMFEQAEVVHLTSPCSDHCPVLLKIIPSVHGRPGPKIMRYEIMWERDESIGDVILDAWDSAPSKLDLGSVASMLRKVMCSLHEWSREKFGSVRRKLELRHTLSQTYRRKQMLAAENRRRKWQRK